MDSTPNLETLEACTLRFLQDSERPLVSLRNLLRHLQMLEGLSSLTADSLLEFLEAHDLFKVARPDGVAGALTEPAIYLKTRVPTDREMKAYMVIELDAIIAALEKAQHEAEAADNVRAQSEIAEMLIRARDLRDRLHPKN
jgi:hypothetical protein